MITLSTIQDIKVMQAQGYSVSGIAEHLHIDRKTVRKYMQQTDFSLPVPLVTPGFAYSATPGAVNTEAMRRGLQRGYFPSFLVQIGVCWGTWSAR